MSKFRTGVAAAPEFPTTPVLLSKARFQRNNILIGNDPVQTRFAEQFFGVPCKEVDVVRDEDILKDTPTLYQVLISKSIEISPELRLKTGIWSLSPVVKGSASATAVIKSAMEILDVKLDKESVNRACDILTEEEIGDVRAALWNAVWVIAGEIPAQPEFWKAPWSKGNWMPKGVDPKYRLNALYRELVGYVLVRDNDEPAARRFGISPAKIKKLKALALDLDRVYNSISELSKWRQLKYDPYLCALKIARIWKIQY